MRAAEPGTAPLRGAGGSPLSRAARAPRAAPRGPEVALGAFTAPGFLSSKDATSKNRVGGGGEAGGSGGKAEEKEKSK